MDRYRTAILLLGVLLAPLTTLRLYAVDEIQYFSYLPSVLFDGDLDFADEYRWFVEREPDAYRFFQGTFVEGRTPAGRPPNNAPIGSAVLWAPFYLVGVALEGILGASGTAGQRGFSHVAISAVCLASMFYGVLGLFLAQETARRFAPARFAFWAVALVWTATNLPFYMYVTPPMSHATSFFVASLFLWWWLRTESTRSRLFVLGAIGGLAASVRWQNVLFLAAPLLAPLLAGKVRNPDGAFRWLGDGVALGLGTVVAFAPQLLVWVLLNGAPTPYGVVSMEGRFSPFAPHLWGVLFSPFHGLLLWSPILLPAFAGLVLGWRDARIGALLVVVGLQLYLISGYAVAFGHGFGQRLFVSSLSAGIVGLAVFLARAAPRLPRAVAVLGGLVCIWWNLSLMVQHGTGMIPRDAGVPLRTLVENQVFRVPARVPSVVFRYLGDRESFFQVDPQRRSEPES